MTTQELYDKLVADMDYIKEKVTRLDERVSGGNGGGLCKQVKDHERAIERRVTRGEFRWIIGVLMTITITGFSILGWLIT